MTNQNLTKTEGRNLEGYQQVLEDIKFILQRGLGRAYKAVDNLKVQTYWQVGERIVREELQHKERADYGKEIIKGLSSDLKVSERNVYNMVEFYRIYPILQTVSAELSWSHYVELLSIVDKEERIFYEVSSIKNSWGVRELRRRIKDKEYVKAKQDNQLIVRLPLQLPVPGEVFKDIYHWNFLELEQNHTEQQLEQALLDNIQKTILEFGQGFAFMSRQQKILIANQWHKVDLVFYHRFLKCVVIIELKTEKFRSEFIGQVNKYLTYFRENKLEGERDPIGLIICKEKDKEEVHYALGNLKEEIFVSEYKTHLPTEEEIEEKIGK